MTFQRICHIEKLLMDYLIEIGDKEVIDKLFK